MTLPVSTVSRPGGWLPVAVTRRIPHSPDHVDNDRWLQSALFPDSQSFSACTTLTGLIKQHREHPAHLTSKDSGVWIYSPAKKALRNLPVSCHLSSFTAWSMGSLFWQSLGKRILHACNLESADHPSIKFVGARSSGDTLLKSLTVDQAIGEITLRAQRKCFCHLIFAAHSSRLQRHGPPSMLFLPATLSFIFQESFRVHLGKLGTTASQLTKGTEQNRGLAQDSLGLKHESNPDWSFWDKTHQSFSVVSRTHFGAPHGNWLVSLTN